jgi:hypothetical protein
MPGVGGDGMELVDGKRRILLQKILEADDAG